MVITNLTIRHCLRFEQLYTMFARYLTIFVFRLTRVIELNFFILCIMSCRDFYIVVIYLYQHKYLQFNQVWINWSIVSYRLRLMVHYFLCYNFFLFQCLFLGWEFFEINNRKEITAVKCGQNLINTQTIELFILFS